MVPVKQNYKIYQGSTFRDVIRWESEVKGYVQVMAATQSAPLVLTTAPHTIPPGWRCKISNVAGMKELNNSTTYYVPTATTPTSLTFQAVNSVGYSSYTTGGIVEYNVPQDLTGYVARMQLREKLTSQAVLHELTTENGGIVLDNINKTIALYISSEDTTEFDFKSAVYSLELASPSNTVQLVTGTITLVTEVTR